MSLTELQPFRNLATRFSDRLKLGFIFAHSGLFALENDDVYYVPQPSKNSSLSSNPVKIDQLCGIGIQDFRAGDGFIIAKTKDGRIYKWKPGDTDATSMITGLPENAEIQDFSVGHEHVVVLLKTGQVFTMGSNKCGQAGPVNSEYVAQFIPIEQGCFDEEKVVAIATGSKSSFALTHDGYVWGWGHAKELGCACRLNRKCPSKLPLPADDKIVQIAAGAYHGTALSMSNTVYHWGRFGLKDELLKEPQIVDLPTEQIGMIVEIAATSQCTFGAFKNADGQVSVYGDWYGSCRDFILLEVPEMDHVFMYSPTPSMLRALKHHRPAFVASRILKALAASFDDPETADIHFVWDDGRILHAHKTFLTLRSEYFRKMFSSQWVENLVEETSDDVTSATAGRRKTIKIQDWSYTVFQTFLRYLYTEKIQTLGWENTLELYKAGDYYGEEDLMEECQNDLKSYISVDNSCQFYDFAVAVEALDLQKYVRDFMRPRFTDVIYSEGFEKLSSELKTRLLRELAVKRVCFGK